ncbi:MAG: hypothetical protein ACT4N4_07610 [Rhodospirillales bacterium]
MPRFLIAAFALVVALPAGAQTPQLPSAQYRPAPVPQGAPAPQAAQPAAQPVALAYIDAARQYWRDGKLLRALDELDAASVSIARQLGQVYAPPLPPAPRGRAVEPQDPQRVAALGASVATLREYRQTAGAAPQAAPGQMNARIVIDSDAVQSMQPLFAPQLPAGVPATVRKVKINNQDAVVAYDPQRRAGEVSVIVVGRLLLQVEGQNVASAEPMLAVMRQWNIAELRRAAGL